MDRFLYSGRRQQYGRSALAYDSANRLTSASGSSYIYDVEDIRLKNLCGNAKTEYTYNTNTALNQLLYASDKNGSTVKYIYGAGLIGEIRSDGEVKVYHFDYRSSTVALTDKDGNITDTFHYNTYGKLTAAGMYGLQMTMTILKKHFIFPALNTQ